MGNTAATDLFVSLYIY